MRAETPLTWDPSVEIPRVVREAGQRPEAAHREGRRRILVQQPYERGGEPVISAGEGLLTERDQPIPY
ncbi:hypothetical protein E1295_44700 [Nonomuraea mesophila]|uniref:Uncharacterized protein n=1 Tax=Nonomuraea mesophila TaxID=2530382 RepID=A0A4R5E629_9ACTN|nr:hypothetical protein E1295_44700 [Nonomuraea mesophila]